MIIAHSEAKALLVSDKLFSKLSKQTIDSLNIVIRTKNLGIIAQHVTATGSTAVPSPDDLAAIIYTSGTTSSPKGVMLTHKAICAQIDMDFGIFPIDETDVFLSVLPLSHTYECSIGLIYAFSKGARVVYLDRQPTASALMPALKAVRPTVMLIVPLHHREDLPPIRFRPNSTPTPSGARSSASASCAATCTGSPARS